VLEPQSTRALRSGRQLTRTGVLLGALAIILGGCVTQADFDRVKRDQQEVRAQIADMQVSLDALSRRVDTMRASADERRGTRQSDDKLRALEQRLAAMETAAAALTPVPTLVGDPPPSPTPPTRVGGSEAAQLTMQRDLQSSSSPESYRRALELYRDGQSEQAIEAFRDFVRTNPKSALADNAQYWVGEAYFAQSDYNRSIIELNEVLLKYPQGDQVPGALLALASAFASSGDKIDAKLVLQKLISDHPESPEARIARQQLQAIAE
jgi:tol-pal system protein YbgF